MNFYILLKNRLSVEKLLFKNNKNYHRKNSKKKRKKEKSGRKVITRNFHIYITICLNLFTNKYTNELHNRILFIYKYC